MQRFIFSINIQNYYLDMILLDQFRKSQKLIKWVGVCQNVESSPSGSNICLNSNTARRNSGNKFFCKGAKVKEENSSRTTAEQSQKQASIPLKKQTQLSSLDHCYAKDPNEEVKTGNR